MGKIKQYPSEQIEQVISTVQELLAEHVLAIYLYGSSVLGGLQINSDIDILVIIDEKITDTIRVKLTKELLLISGTICCKDKRPLEVTILNRNDIISQQFPPRYEYMYGEWLRGEIEAGTIPQSNYDADLIILLWQARKYSIVLKGQSALDLIPIISEDEVIRAIQNSLPSLLEGMMGDERNALLTLARMWYTLENHDLCAKNIAGEWTLERLPKSFKPLMELAVKGYLGECEDNWSSKKSEVLLLADFIIKHINQDSGE